MGRGFYRKSFVVAVVLHATAIGLAVVFALVQGCRYRRRPVETIEFTIAVADSETTPEAPVPEAPPEPPPPPSTPPVPTPPKPPEPKPEPPKPEPPKPPKRTIQTGRRVVRRPRTPQPVKPTTLSDEEIKKWLSQRVRVGATDSLPDNEQARNFSLIRNALYDAWQQPPASEAGRRPAVVEFSLGPGGVLSNPRVATSSGSVSMDASVLAAVRRVGRVQGLASRFLQAFPRLSVEFKIEE